MNGIALIYTYCNMHMDISKINISLKLCCHQYCSFHPGPIELTRLAWFSDLQGHRPQSQDSHQSLDTYIQIIFTCYLF